MNTEKNEDTLVRNYKDSVFRKLFNDKKNLIELYNAIFDADYDEDTPLEFETIEEVLFKTIKNDIAFTIEDRYVVLVEHQRSLCSLLQNPALQLTVKVYNANEGRATELLKKCRILWEYSRFVAIVRKYAEEGTMNSEVVQKILKECREEEARELSKEDGFNEGFDEGIQEGVRLTAQKMKQKGIEFAVIAECTGLSEQEIDGL